MSIETYTKISTVTLSSSASSVTFSNIPQSYTHLRIVCSVRSDRSGAVNSYIELRPNEVAESMTIMALVGTGTTRYGQTESAAARYMGEINAASSTNFIYTQTEINLFHYTSNQNKGILTNFAHENDGTPAYAGFLYATWDGTSPITSFRLSDGLANFVSGTSFTIYGIKNSQKAAGNSVKAIGGNISYDGTYVVHTFTSTANFVPQSNINAEYLVVAGGGATYYDGGTDRSWSGGGGAGGYRTNINGTRISLTVGNTYQVTVGAGGARGTTAGKGSNSGIGSIISSTGGGGGPNGNGDTGKIGGSGSGGSGQLNQFTAGGAGNEGGYSPVEGYAGGTGGNGAGNTFGAGGGGSGGVGSNGSINGAAGGPGTSNSISGSAVTYAAGGKGGNSNGAAFDSAVANTGNGAGYGGNGGSGIVIIRYKG